MELTKKNKLTIGATVAALLLGVVSFNKCPWLQRQWNNNVVPLLREAAPADAAPVSSD